MFEQQSLGPTEIKIPRLGIGTWAWGDRFFWGYGTDYDDTDLRQAFETSLQAGIRFFDTAEIYGFGHSERALGRFIREHRSRPSSNVNVLIATKFFPYPWRFRKKNLLDALRGSLRRLQLERVDLYQIHWPTPPMPIETWVDALADAVQAGLTRAVGVSNYNADQTRRAYEVLARRGVPLASNQIEYSLLDRSPERNGLMQTCRELGITLIAYSPLGKGLLTGKYSPSRRPPGLRGRGVSRAYLSQVQSLVAIMREIGEAHGGRTPSQVALNWLICKGAVPIPGAKRASHAEENAGALGWQLTPDEVAHLDAISDRI